MAATPVMSMIGCKAALDALTALVNGGGTGHLYWRTGAPPATSLTADSGTLLATLTMSATAFAAATSAEANGKAKATANSIASDTNAAATGTAGHFRVKNGSGVVILQGTIGTSSADMIVNSTTVTAGDTCAVTSFLARLANGTTAE